MADSFIQLSPDSTGKKVDTRTAPDGDHREVQVIGSPTTADVAEVDTTNGLDVDVTRLPALPAGSNNIGDVDIVSLPNEGQQTMANSISVAIASDQGTVPVSLASGGTTQYAEDTAHSSGDLVTMAGVVQQSADAALSSDGDRSTLQVDASGFLKVNIKAGAGSGGTAMADDAAFTVATTQGTPAFALADETSPDSVDEGDAGALRMTLDRKLLTRVVGGTDANRLDVDASGHAQVDIAAASVTVPVSAASLPLPTGAATSALQTQPGVDIGDVTVNNAAGAAAVNVQDGGNSLTVDNATLSVVGGGTEATAQRVTIANDSTGVVSVDDNGGSLTVDGSVTANAGTNLNTSALALETGGNLAAAAASLSVIDDWDETDRAKVNPIAGQAGVQGASGTVTALTQRVVLATDVGLPAGTANIGDVDIASVAAGTVMEVVGDVASDAAVPANPVIVGARASTAQPTPVSADGDSVNIWANRKGAPIVSMAPHVGLLGDPWTLTGETAQYTTTQTSTVLVAGGASERLVVTQVQIQVGGTTAGAVQLYFGTGAYSRGTNLAIFDGEFAPSATLKPGVVMTGPFISAANGDDLLVTTSAAVNPLTITVWFYVLT